MHDDWHADWDDIPPPDLESDDDLRPTKGSLLFLSLLIELLVLVGVSYLCGHPLLKAELPCFWGLFSFLFCSFLAAVVTERRKKGRSG